MKILRIKCIINRRNNNCILSMATKTTTATTTATTTTTAIAIIMIFMQAIVSVNTTFSHTIWPDTEMTTAAPSPSSATTETRAKTLNDLSKNPIILAIQQSPKIPTQKQTQTQTPYSSSSATAPAAASTAATTTALKASSTLNLLHVPGSVRPKTTIQPKARSTGNFASHAAEGVCKSLTTAWGDVDPNVFYICDMQTKTPLQLRCPQGKGFFLGLGYSGCIPYEQWPACISSGHRVAVCDSEHMQQPWESKDPNKFYVCLKETIQPTIVNCEPGKGFVHAIVTVTTGVGSSGGGGGGGGGGVGVGTGARTTSEIVGCAKWEKWRYYMHCNAYI